MNISIEELKQELNDAMAAQGNWQAAYSELMKAVYGLPVLFFALSKERYNSKEAAGVPLISTKDFDGAASLYVFTEIETAEAWMRHYEAVSEDMEYGLIGALEKSDFNFRSVFPVAEQLGAQMIMLDEGASYVGIELGAFLKENDIDTGQIEIPVDMRTVEDMVENGQVPRISFPEIPAVPLKSS